MQVKKVFFDKDNATFQKKRVHRKIFGCNEYVIAETGRFQVKNKSFYKKGIALEGNYIDE